MLMQNKRHGALCLCTTAAIGLFTSIAAAGGGVNPIGPFSGDISESWESFPNYLDDGDFYMDEPTVCFGGAGQIADGGVMAIYEPGVAGFNLADPGAAQVVDGAKAHGLDAGPDATASITFDPPVCAFGGFWAAAEDGSQWDGIVDFAFLDADGNLIGTATFDYNDDGDGIGDLQWAGWESNTPIATVNYRGDFVVNDALQASYGDCGGGEEKCKGDGNGDGVVDVNDLLGLLAAWGPCNSGSECEVGFVCGGEIVFCGSQGQCICFTGFDGSPVCAFDDSCSNPQCFNGDEDCPTGMVCVIDTCCTDPTCIPNCEGMSPSNAPEIKLGDTSAANSMEFLQNSPIGNGFVQVDSGNPDCPYDFNGDGFVDVNDLLSLLANWGPCPTGELCEVGFVCGGDIVICGEFKGFQCICFTHFSGQPVCAASSSCSNPPCPNGQDDCPDGFLCIIDTCCADNVCLEDCVGNQIEDCEVGFTCGDQITPCPVDPENCVCVTNWDGTPDCVDISGGGGCDLFVTCNNGPDECPDGTSCIINTCCADAICIPTCQDPGSGSSCDVGFTCGDTLTPCPDGGGDNCWCWTYFDGSFQCAENGLCDTLCPNGQSDCPPGTLCMIDTCCTDPVCLPECGGGQSECEVGFVCGGDITNCGSEGQCFCFTSFDGTPACVFDRACVDLPTCPNGDCPDGFTCCIDTCCGEPICFEDCEGLAPGSGVQPQIGDHTGIGVYNGRAAGN